MEPCLFRHGKLKPIETKLARQMALQWSHVFSDMVRSLIDDKREWLSDDFNGAMSFQTW